MHFVFLFFRNVVRFEFSFQNVQFVPILSYFFLGLQIYLFQKKAILETTVVNFPRF